jgi:hypothetical protein
LVRGEKNKEYNFRNEIESYCWSDVQLSTEGCLSFRASFINVNNVEPFRVAITIASLCNYIYRKDHMPSQTIGVIPEHGYNPQEKTSKKCISWLKFIASSRKINIRHE